MLRFNAGRVLVRPASRRLCRRPRMRMRSARLGGLRDHFSVMSSSGKIMLGGPVCMELLSGFQLILLLL